MDGSKYGRKKQVEKRNEDRRKKRAWKFKGMMRKRKSCGGSRNEKRR